MRPESRRIEERRENAGDQAAAALQRALQASTNDLMRLRAPSPGDDALVIEFRSSEIRVYPDHGLLFYPIASASPEASSIAFREAEIYEYQQQNYRKAITALPALTRSPDRSVRAGAHLRIARDQREAGQLEPALRTYAELGTYGETSAGGLPAELVARRARCALLAQLGRSADLVREAAELYNLLRNGHWRLSQAAYDVHAAEAAAWLGTDRGAEAPSLALAEAVAWLAARESHEPHQSGQACIVRQGRPETPCLSRPMVNG